MRKQITLLFTLLVFFGCRPKTCEIDPAVAKIPLDLKLERLEKPFFAARTEGDIRQFLTAHPEFARKFLQPEQYPDEATFVNALHRLATEPNLQKFASTTSQSFGDMKDIETSLENAFRHLRFNYPKAKIPEVKTYITGLLGQDLFVSDNLIVLGLDYFAGPQAAFRPQQPAYILKRYDKPYMIPAVITQLSARYNQTDPGDKTMLAEMVSYGKSFYFTERLMPCTPDSLIIGYTAQEIADVSHNEGKIWAHFVEQGLLYETNHFKVNKYTGERPNIPEISKRCPGRVAIWMGWQMVRKYMAENPEVSLAQLMKETDAQKIFRLSRYKPKRN